MSFLSTACLDEFVGKGIEEICPLKFGKKGDSHNHCAHFVAHVLKLHRAVVPGTTCANMVYGGMKNATAGAIIRVNDIYNVCADLAAPEPLGCLAYYTVPANLDKEGMMGTMSQKHVGICLGGFVYNYGNTLDKVRKDNVGDLAQLYGAKTITLYTVLPTGYTALTLAEVQALAAK
jgi:hypothetical protein